MLYSVVALSLAATVHAGISPNMDMYKQLMSNQARTWEPVDPRLSPFSNHTNDDIMGLMGLSTRGLVGTTEQEYVSNKFFNGQGQLPTDFDARTKFSSCIGAIRNQAKCGSCWAFGGAETLSDNLCIQGKHTGPLSAQDLVSCDTTDHGCNGGDLIDAWNRLSNVGIVSQECMPYTAGGGTVNACPIVCPSGSGDFTRFKCGQAANMLEDELAIKNGVYQMGAAETGFYVYEDFMSYKSGIYHHDNTTSNMPLGGHAVKIVGWGQSGFTKYWLVANSWGSAWGMDGFFKIDMADKDSAFALGGAFNCGSLAPAPAAPTPAGNNCEDILPSSECSDDPKDCAVRHLVCAKTCKCCDYFQPPAYCKSE